MLKSSSGIDVVSPRVEVGPLSQAVPPTERAMRPETSRVPRRIERIATLDDERLNSRPKKTAGRIRRPGPLDFPDKYYLSQTGSPSPAPALTVLVVPTATPQVMPGICGCVTVADQYEVLGEMAGDPTPDVEANLPASSVSVP